MAGRLRTRTAEGTPTGGTTAPDPGGHPPAGPRRARPEGPIAGRSRAPAEPPGGVRRADTAGPAGSEPGAPGRPGAPGPPCRCLCAGPRNPLPVLDPPRRRAAAPALPTGPVRTPGNPPKPL